MEIAFMETVHDHSGRSDHSGSPDGVVSSAPLFESLLVNLDPDPSSIGEGSWAVADGAALEVLNCIHPTLDSDKRRNGVIEYVQRLIRESLGCEVFPYGSVPLKTYLCDGDIDLTVLVSPKIEEFLPHDILVVLQGEEQNENAEYEVKDAQFIDAEVKLVKCLVQNIVIDISFNQLGGLCTLCFLEQVDRLVQKNHLFKRSIILIKAWCYYESRVLGAHHGLISTYALETLILYIFHLFHSSLHHPIAVLYSFLHYFSQFDWENCCLSLKGPVCKSSLPDLVVETPEDGRLDFMLSEEFLKNCMNMFSLPSEDIEKNTRGFFPKHLNIIDPLKDYNNLGRSVNRGNFYRIRSAFKYGAHKLGEILLLPSERISDEIRNFFSSTLERHGHKRMDDIQSTTLAFGLKGSDSDILSLSSHAQAPRVEMQLRPVKSILDKEMPRGKDSTQIFGHELDRYSMELVSSHLGSESCHSKDRTTEPLLNPLSDLSGDYDNHIRSLVYGQSCYNSLSGPMLPNRAASPSLFQNKITWETVGRSSMLKKHLSRQSNASGEVMTSSVSPKAKQNARETGTSIPNNSYSWRQRPSQGRGNNTTDRPRLQLYRQKSANNDKSNASSGSNSKKYKVQNSTYALVCTPSPTLNCSTKHAPTKKQERGAGDGSCLKNEEDSTPTPNMKAK